MFSTAATAGGADVRVDEEGKEKYQQILDLLLAGGYFRARITGLSPFDKVIGGMAWAITSSAGDLDIDIFFQEDAQIGQKIKLGEQILDGLKRLGCTLPLQAFQIQGLDFKSIFPVIQWLITKVMEVRAETGDLVRAYSEAQFNKVHSMPSDAAFALKLPKAAQYAASVSDTYRPRRQFVHRGGDAHSLGEHEELQLVLLEYGTRGASAAALAAAAAASAGSSSSTASTGGKGGSDKSEALAREEEAAYQRRMARLAALGDGDLSDSTVAGFIPSAQIAAMLDNFEAGLNAEDGPIAGVQAKKLAERQHAAHVASLEAQVTQFKQEGQKLTAKNNAARDEHDQLVADVAQRRAFTARLRAAIAELDALETDENRPVLAKLKQLVALNESLRAHEAAFRRSCATELARLKALIAEAEQKARAADDGGLAEREALLSEAEAKDARKREQLENALAERRCAIAAAERQLDAVPSRVEMQQYQRQFVELYQQIAAKEVETRRYFNTYNTLEDTRTFLNRETQIYSSILEGYKAAMSSKSGRANFATEMANIAKGVQDSLGKVTGKLDTETSKKQALDQAYKELVDKERLFVKLAGKFAEACGRNEKLEAEIEQLTAAAGK